MTTLLRPDVRRMLEDLARRVGILERRVVRSAAKAVAGDATHDGAGIGSTVILLSANSPTASGAGAVGIGTLANAAGAAAVALGASASAVPDYATAIGGGAEASQEASTALGADSHANATGSIAIGNGAIASALAGVAIGGSSGGALGAAASGLDSVALGPGDGGLNGPAAAGAYSIAFGLGANASRSYSIAIGLQAEAIDNQDTIAIGRQANASDTGSVALGDNVSTTNSEQVNTGQKRLFTGARSTAPADADLINAQWSVWVDESTNELKVKVKYSTGTVKNGVVASLS